MIRAYVLCTREAVRLLLRDKIFAPALMAAASLAILAFFASEWGIEEYKRITTIMGLSGFQFIGGLIALFWGIKMLSDSRQDGAIEIQLAAPVPRVVWLWGKYTGLAITLGLTGLLLGLLWQGVFSYAQFGPLTPTDLAAFAYIVVGWLVLGALATLLSCFLRQGVALFAGLALWIIGLAASLVLRALPENTTQFTKSFVRLLARAWDLQQFNLIQYAAEQETIAAVPGLLTRGAYAGTLILLLLSVAGLILTKRDIV